MVPILVHIATVLFQCWHGHAPTRQATITWRTPFPSYYRRPSSQLRSDLIRGKFARAEAKRDPCGSGAERPRPASEAATQAFSRWSKRHWGSQHSEIQAATCGRTNSDFLLRRRSIA